MICDQIEHQSSSSSQSGKLKNCFIGKNKKRLSKNEVVEDVSVVDLILK
jgi:hypothetical protein